MVEKNEPNRLLKPPLQKERGGVGSKREHICAGVADFLLNIYRRGGYQIHLELLFLSDARRQLVGLG